MKIIILLPFFAAYRIGQFAWLFAKGFGQPPRVPTCIQKLRHKHADVVDAVVALMKLQRGATLTHLRV